MNLTETVKALEAKNITVAIDLGVHENCTLDSNCPLAIQLRRLVTDTGITLEQLLEGHEAVTNPPPLDYDMPAFDAHINLRVAGKDIAIDFNDVISESMRTLVRDKLEVLNTAEAMVRDVGVALYDVYLREIYRQRDNRVLPQLRYSARELLDAKCFIASDDGYYYFLFSVDYNPQYLIRDGVRYKVSDEDIRGIRRKAYVQIVITQDNKIYSVLLLDESGDKLLHYHGDSATDCWGAVHIPKRWDRRLSSLLRFVHSLMGSLATINLGSLLVHEPPDMPNNEDLLERSTELGREGEFEESEVEPTERPGWGRTAWGRGGQPRGRTEGGDTHTFDGVIGVPVETGRRRRAPPTGDVQLTVDEEMMRRYGVTEHRHDMNLVCRLCGVTVGGHTGERGEVCPRDPNRRGAPGRERLRRWGSPDIPTNMELTCLLCGERAGVHYDHGLTCPRDHRE